MTTSTTTSTETSHDPRTGAVNGTVACSSPSDVDAALDRAAAAAPLLAAEPPAVRRDWLDAVAAAIEAHADELATLADGETALGVERMRGEVARTAAQLRFYGAVAAEGSFLGATLDGPTATTGPLARVNVPVGPVAVFGASNFPLAFSVLGNDTASAIAAGCPVVAKAHPAHPLLSRRVGELATEALTSAGAPDGTFSLVVGFEAGTRIVLADEIEAVAFTGSEAGGMALWRLANARTRVIPVFAEMGTVNPVVVTPGAAGRIDEIAAGFVGSFTFGAGQVCTKPGLLLAPRSSGAPEAVGDALVRAAPATSMLTEQIAATVLRGVEELLHAGAKVVTRTPGPEQGWSADAAVLTAPLAALQPGSRLLEECFGPVVVVVEYDHLDEVLETMATMPGALAGAVFGAGDDDPAVGPLLERLSRNVGRVTVDNWPTGAPAVWAQQHGGPWPATTHPAATSVGAAALDRFLRPVTWQNVPDPLLPAPLRADNPWALPRRVEGELVLP